MSIKTIDLIRHGETEWNVQGILQGWFDSPLTEQGRQAAMALRSNYEQLPTIFSSDLGRAVATAKIIAPNATVQLDPRLREIYLGDWQGRAVKTLEHDSSYQTYCQAPHRFQPTTQESFQQVTERMVSFVRYLQALPDPQIVVVSHGVAMLCLLNYLQNRPLNMLWKDGMITGATAIRMKYDASKHHWSIHS